MTDRQTDRRTDARGKTICLPTLSGGDIIPKTLDTNETFVAKRGCKCFIVAWRNVVEQLAQYIVYCTKKRNITLFNSVISFISYNISALATVFIIYIE